MAGETYSAEAIVLGKTKLGESDLILRMLASDGSLLEAIAKGARKPQSPLSARLELFNRAELLIARGRGLDIVKETRLVSGRPRLHSDPLYGSAAAAVAEFAYKVAQPGLEAPRLFGLTDKTLEVLSQVQPERVCLVAAANLLKASAITGSRPSFDCCVVCGDAIGISDDSAEEVAGVRFSLIDGGVVCGACASSSETELFRMSLVRWAYHLLYSSYEDIAESEDDAALGVDLLHLVDRWIAVQFGMRLKSIGSLIQYCAL